MKPPLKNNFSKDAVNKLIDIIKLSNIDGVEYGAALCSNNNIDIGKICKGIECSVDIEKESCMDKKIQGSFHTHNILKHARESYNSSGLKETVSFNDYLIIFLEHNKTSFSNGDILTTLTEWLYHNTGGTVCVSNDISTKMLCATKRDVTTLKEAQALKKIEDNYEELRNEKASDEVMSSFFIEMFDLSDLNKKRKK